MYLSIFPISLFLSFAIPLSTSIYLDLSIDSFLELSIFLSLYLSPSFTLFSTSLSLSLAAYHSITQALLYFSVSMAPFPYLYV